MEGNCAVPLELYFYFSSSQFRRLTVTFRLILASNPGAMSRVCVYCIFFFNEWSSVIGECAHSGYKFAGMNHHLTDDGLSPPVHSYLSKMIYLING